tara:strand:- start:93 stop:503 length:411 start_codon:yes stop_codon:yes gene_type:complete
METLDKTNSVFSQKALIAMRSAGPWMKFIAIVFFVLSLIMLIASFVALTQTAIGGFIYLIVTSVLIYTNVLLLGMGNSIRSMGLNLNSESIDSFFTKCRNYFVIWGVILIIYLSMIIIAFAVGGLGMMQMIQKFGG